MSLAGSQFAEQSKLHDKNQSTTRITDLLQLLAVLEDRVCHDLAQKHLCNVCVHVRVCERVLCVLTNRDKCNLCFSFLIITFMLLIIIHVTDDNMKDDEKHEG